MIINLIFTQRQFLFSDIFVFVVFFFNFRSKENFALKVYYLQLFTLLKVNLIKLFYFLPMITTERSLFFFIKKKLNKTLF